MQEASPNTEPVRRFAVAFSFPGEVRHRIERIAALLAAELSADRILYDQYHEAEFAVPNLDTHLQQLYYEDSELIVVVLCGDYERKEWTGVEWRAIREHIKQQEDRRIMFLRADDGKVRGTFSFDGYIDLRTHTDEQVATLVLQRLRRLVSVRPIRWCEHILHLIPEFERTLRYCAVAFSGALLFIIPVQHVFGPPQAPTPVIEQQYATVRLLLSLMFVTCTAGALAIAYLTIRKMTHARAVQHQYTPWKHSCDHEAGREELAMLCERIAMRL